MHLSTATFISAGLYFLCFFHTGFCMNECHMVDQLVDIKFQIKDIRGDELDLRDTLQSSEESIKRTMRDTQTTISELQQILSEMLVKEKRRHAEENILTEQFRNLTTYVISRWDKMGQALTVMEGDLRQNLTSLRSEIRQGNLASNLTIEQVERSMQQAVSDFKNHVQALYQEVANVSKAQLSAKSKCIGYNYDYFAKFNVCYRLGYDTQITTSDAHRQICLSENADLLTVKNPDLLEWLKDLIQLSPKIRSVGLFHVDGTDEQSEGEWIDKYDQPLWTKWAPNQPDNWRTGEHCLTLIKAQGYLMNDVECNVKTGTGYICEIKV